MPDSREARSGDIQRTFTIDEVYRLITEATYGPQDASHASKDDAWAKASFDEAVDLLCHGWQTLVPKIESEVRSDLGEAFRPTPRWNVQGSEVDVAAYLQGVPEDMIEVIQEEAPSQVVRIGFDIAQSSSVSKQTIEAVGKQVLILVESLRLAGIPSEIWACCGVRGYSDRDVLDYRVLIQTSNAPVDVSRIAYWLAHASALRRIIFAVMEQENEETRSKWNIKHPGTYGYPATDYAESDFDEWAPNSSVEAVKAWATRILNRRVGR